MAKMTLDELRARHSALVYRSSTVAVVAEDLALTFNYTLLPDKELQTKFVFHGLGVDLGPETSPIIQNMAFHLGMVEALSYWKLACPAEIRVEAKGGHPDQLPFWQNLLQKGLSEFFFINKINGWQPDFVSWKFTQPSTGAKDTKVHTYPALLPIGGGKDSAVSAATLQKSQMPFVPMVINPSGRMEQVLAVIHSDKVIRIDRQLDPQFAELNTSGYLNGHTPFSAMAAFTGVIAAFLTDSPQVIVSNEWSANEGNAVFLGQVINHQYSKSVEFEFAFREYCQNWLSETIQYFSLLRPWHELQIGRAFASLPEYHFAFLSCNRGQSRGIWCGECPKCLFTWIILAPFLPLERLEKIFGQNFWQKESFILILEELTGIVEAKSLECVGTRAESKMALALVLGQWQDQALPPLLAHAQHHFAAELPHLRVEATELLASWQTPNGLPANYQQALQKGWSFR